MTFEQHIASTTRQTFDSLEREGSLSDVLEEAAVKSRSSANKEKSSMKENFDESWAEKEEDVFQAFVKSLACSKSQCEGCLDNKSLDSTIRCLECKKHLCSSCA